MPLPEEVVNQWVQETQAIGLELFELSQRCRRLIAKTESNGIHLEAAPVKLDIPIDDVRTLYTNVVKDLVQMVEGGAVGRADRSTMIWKVARRQQV